MAEGIKPPPMRNAWQWADSSRILTSISSSEAGPFRSERTPYIREPMEALSHRSDVRTVVVMKGSQLGFTEVCLNWHGHNIIDNPGPMLVIHPTVENAKRWSKQKFKTMIDTTPELRERIKDSRSRDSGNEILIKEFPAGFLAMGGSNSPAGLRGYSARDVTIDDFDGCAADAGGEGAPDELAENRQGTFSDAKTLLISTPTDKGFSNIERAFEQTDQRKFFVPCINCHEYEVIAWAQIKWPEGSPLDAYCECLYCGFHLQNFHKNDMLPKGEWRPTAEAKIPNWVGYHLSGLYSPHGWESWGKIAVGFLRAKGVPEKMRVWVNTKLAETFEDQAGEEFNASGFLARRENYNESMLPDGVCYLTAAVDVQDDRLEVQIDGWGRDKEYWNIAYIRIPGDPSFLRLNDDPNNQSVWQLAKNQLARVFQHPRFGELRIMASCVDTGGHHTLKAYEFCRTVGLHRVWAIKGKDGKIPLWPKKPSRRNKGKVPLYLVGVDTGKSAVYANLRIEVPGPSYRHYSIARDQDYFDQLTSERKRTRYAKGFPIYWWFLPSGKRNEALDLSVYTMAALDGAIQAGLDLNKRADKLDEQYPNLLQPVQADPVTGSIVPVMPKPKRIMRDRVTRRSSYLD